MYEWRELAVESCTVLTEYLRMLCGVACAVAYQIYLGGDFYCAYNRACACVIARASACATVCVRVCVCARVCVCIHSYQLHSTGGKESRCWGKRRHRAFPLLRHIFSRNTRYCIGLVCSTEKFILRVCVWCACVQKHVNIWPVTEMCTTLLQGQTLKSICKWNTHIHIHAYAPEQADLSHGNNAPQITRRNPCIMQ